VNASEIHIAVKADLTRGFDKVLRRKSYIRHLFSQDQCVIGIEGRDRA
jgi:hypothetical protein